MVHRLLQEFESTTPEPLRIVLLHRSSLLALKRENTYWKRFYRRFCQFLYHNKGYFDSYAGGVFKVLKTFFRYLLVEKGYPVGEYYRSFRVPVGHLLPVVLSPERLRRLITDTGFYNRLKPHLKLTLDLFVFGCTTGLRYSDLMNLRKSAFLRVEEGAVLLLHTIKTGTLVRIPLHNYAVQILQKYHRNARFLLPRLSNTNFNLNIKEIIRLAGWDEVLPRYRYRKGKLVEIRKPDGKSWRFYDHVSTHTMRRTAITSLLMLGVDEHTVRRISGHAPGSREFYRYVALVQDYMDTRVREAHRRLLEPGKGNIYSEK